MIRAKFTALVKLNLLEDYQKSDLPRATYENSTESVWIHLKR